jgi:AcrR family transcriptional regulator
MNPTTVKQGPSAPRWQRRKEARPSEIVSAALDLFVEKGFAATRLDEVARRAGVTKGTMYLYFESKEALFKAVVRETLVPTIARAEQIVGEYEGDTRELFRTLVRGWWNLIGETRASGIPKLMMAEAANFPELAKFYLEEVASRGKRVFQRALQRGIDRGEFREFDVTIGARLVIAPLILATTWKHSFHHCVPDSFDSRQLVEQHIETFLRGIEAAPGSEAPRA